MTAILDFLVASGDFYSDFQKPLKLGNMVEVGRISRLYVGIPYRGCL